jgi:uncharacterized protein YqgC (DUF456 family)
LKTLALVIAIIMFLIGLIGTILPALPGVLLIFGGMLVYGFMTGFASLSIWFFNKIDISCLRKKLRVQEA